KEDTAAEVTELYPHREIRIRVAGKHKRDLLTIISYELEKLHVPFHRLKFQQLIPCNCSVCRAAAEPYFYRLDDLKTRLDHGKAEIECNKAPFETVQIRPLLDDVGLSTFSYDLPTLLQQLEATFNEQETRTLSFELGIDYDDLGGQGLKANLRELINYLNRRGRLEELVERVRRQRPHLPT
ncbi:MAG: hypothetical protein KC425_25405, partial [Anaerolineales bacterium]|nr:hypothetical protein [Anaerolineales bacterium]